MIILTPEERRRFADYCLEEAASYRDIVKQFDHLPNGEMLAKPIKLRMAAFVVVARYLGGIHEDTISG